MSSKRKPTVLLVDDEPLFRSSAAEALSEPGTGIDVITAANGGQAVEILQNQEVDLLVTDLHMPILDGLGLLREYMSIQPGCPALVLTAYASTQLEDDLRLLGGIGYLEKPVDISDLLARVRSLLEPTPKGHIEGITLFSFLQLVELERKTCRLAIHSEGKTALLFFSNGELVHAEAEGLEGDEAVLQLGDWSLPDIDIDYPTKTSKRTVTKNLTELLLDAARISDERDAGKSMDTKELDPSSRKSYGAERGRQWLHDAENLLGGKEPPIIVGLRLEDGSITTLRGPETMSDWSTAILGLANAAIRLSNREARATCEVITNNVGIGVIWNDGEALLVADALPARNSSAWFRSQLGTLTRVVWDDDSKQKGGQDGKD